MNDLSNVNWSSLLIVCAAAVELFSYSVDTATLTGTLSPIPPVYGQKHVLKCQFSLEAGENFEGLKLYLGNRPQVSMTVAQLRASTGEIVWAADAPGGLRKRGVVSGNRQQAHLSLAVNKTQCEDRNRPYLCYMEYAKGVQIQEPLHAVISGLSELKIPPRGGLQLTREPGSKAVHHGSFMTFWCWGDVGSPAGTLRSIYIQSPRGRPTRWFQSSGTGDKNERQELTSDALTTSPKSSDDSCSFSRTSNITLQLLHKGPNKQAFKIVMECWIDQPQAPLKPDNTSCPREHSPKFCFKTSPVVVLNTASSVSSIYTIVISAIGVVIVILVIATFVIQRRQAPPVLTANEVRRLSLAATARRTEKTGGEVDVEASSVESAAESSVVEDHVSEVGQSDIHSVGAASLVSELEQSDVEQSVA